VHENRFSSVLNFKIAIGIICLKENIKFGPQEIIKMGQSAIIDIRFVT
jgi:hypothetical protein